MDRIFEIINNCQIYSFFGILQDKTKLNEVFLLDIGAPCISISFYLITDQRTWTQLETKGGPPEPRNDSVVRPIGDGKVVVFGGTCSRADVWILIS